MKRKQPTYTSLVEAVLREADDFMSLRMIMDVIHDANMNQITAALFSLRKYHVVDVVVNADGKGWWYVLPMEEDQRTHHISERTPESKPRKRRKARAM